MRIKEIKLYEYNELDDHAKEKARDWYRTCTRDDTFWSESVIEDAEEIAKMLGVSKPVFYWSGFSSQGDGACLIGQWYASDCRPDKVDEHAPIDEKLKEITQGFREFIKQYPEAHFTATSIRGNDARIEVDLGSDTGNDEDEETIKDLARDFSHRVYRSLEKEYEYVNADEQVEESIITNEYEFTEDGHRA